MKLIYFENQEGRTVAIVASAIIAMTAKRLPSLTPTLITCVGGILFEVRDDIDTAQQKLRSAFDA